MRKHSINIKIIIIISFFHFHSNSFIVKFCQSRMNFHNYQNLSWDLSVSPSPLEYFASAKVTWCCKSKQIFIF